jgi:hypothetical protein
MARPTVAETMFLRMPAAMLLGALLGWVARRHIPGEARAVLGVAALVLASFAMPFWMLPVMMDKAEAGQMLRATRDVSLALTGAATVICFSNWAPVLRHLWVLEQVGMLVRYGIWYGFAPVALCAAWDASAQETAGQGLVAASVLLGGAYLVQCWRARHDVLPRGGLT